MTQHDTCGCRSSLMTAWKVLRCYAAAIFVFYLFCYRLLLLSLTSTHLHVPHTHSFIIRLHIFPLFSPCVDGLTLTAPLAQSKKNKNTESKLWGDIFSSSYNTACPFTPTFNNDIFLPYKPCFPAFSLFCFQFILPCHAGSGGRGGKQELILHLLVVFF